MTAAELIAGAVARSATVAEVLVVAMLLLVAVVLELKEVILSFQP